MLNIESKKNGAELTSIKKDGKEMLFQGNKIVDKYGKVYWNRQSPILFPIVGQLKDGKTQIDGKFYEMSQHGFARDMEFKEIEKTNSKHHYSLKYNKETLKKYPYKFELDIIYEVIENKLEITYIVKNIDKKEIYFGLGGHPAFNCDYSDEEYAIAFEEEENKIEFLKLKNGLIDIEKARNLLENNKIYIKQDTFKEDAIILKDIKSRKIALKNIKENKNILEFNIEEFPYLGIWSKKGAPFICIEPWQNTADKIDSTHIYKEKENICKLNIEESKNYKYSIKFF